MTDSEALWTAMYDAEDNYCSGFPGECCAPPTHGSSTDILAALAASGWSLVRSDELTGRTAALMHMEGEVDDCDSSESLWCQPCWDDAAAWLAPDADYAMAREVRAALEKGAPR